MHTQPEDVNIYATLNLLARNASAAYLEQEALDTIGVTLAGSAEPPALIPGGVCIASR